MQTDDEDFQRLDSKERPQLPGSLAAFIGQTLSNHYQDTFLSPLSDQLQKLVHKLEKAETDEKAAAINLGHCAHDALPEFRMVKIETDDHALLVDGSHPLRREAHFVIRLAGLVVSLAAISGAIYWASTL